MCRTIGILIALVMAAPLSLAALPSQFSECLNEQSGTKMSIYDLREIAKVSGLTICQNQVGLLNKYDMMELLKNPNVKAGVSLARTNHSKEDLIQMAQAGSYLLYVDSPELEKTALSELLGAGVQLVILSATAGLRKEDLLALAKIKPYVLNVNSVLLKEDLKLYAEAGIQVVIRASQSGLTKDDIIEVAKAKGDLTILP